jgi:hypothetical protein
VPIHKRTFLADISPDSRPVERDFSSHRGTPQRNSAATNLVGSQIVRFPASQGRNSWLGLHQGTPLPSSSVVSDPIARSCRCRQRPQPGDQRQDFLEHLPRHRDLGHLEGHVAAVADDLGADLDQLLPAKPDSMVRLHSQRDVTNSSKFGSEFARDSPLEGGGFELSLPPQKERPFRGSLLLVRRSTGAGSGPSPGSDRQFESTSLQRRVRRKKLPITEN